MPQPKGDNPLMHRHLQQLGLTEWALAAGIIANTLGISWAIGSVGLLTFLSGVVVAASLSEKERV